MPQIDNNEDPMQFALERLHRMTVALESIGASLAHINELATVSKIEAHLDTIAERLDYLNTDSGLVGAADHLGACALTALNLMTMPPHQRDRVRIDGDGSFKLKPAKTEAPATAMRARLDELTKGADK